MKKTKVKSKNIVNIFAVIAVVLVFGICGIRAYLTDMDVMENLFIIDDEEEIGESGGGENPGGNGESGNTGENGENGGESGNTGGETSYVYLSDCEVSPQSIGLYVGELQDISITSLLSGEIEGVTYSSENTSVATVTSNGRVKGVGVGTTQITLTGKLSGATANVNVTVNPAVGIYGQYVDLGTNIIDKSVALYDKTYPLADWRVFRVTDEGVLLIASDYLPNENLPSTTNLYAHTNKYTVYSDSASNFVNALNNENVWKVLLDGTRLEDNVEVVVKGAVSKEDWINSWNEHGGNISVNLTSSVEFTSSSVKSSLYIPHTSAINTCIGYWLGTSYNNSTEWAVSGDSGRSHIGHAYKYDWKKYSVRPCVFLPSSIKLDKSGTVWTLAN